MLMLRGTSRPAHAYTLNNINNYNHHHHHLKKGAFEASWKKGAGAVQVDGYFLLGFKCYKAGVLFYDKTLP